MIFTEVEVFESSGSSLKPFYDDSLRHTLIIQENSCLVWPQSSSSRSLTKQKIHVIYKDPIFLKCIFARVSLDFIFVACQISSTQIIVIDISQNQRYTVSIKPSSTVVPNQILPNGIIWSDHGGGSQDLVLVTSFGIELHKVSSARRQCKLSRQLSEYSPHAVIESFWYDPASRLLVPLYVPTPAGDSPRGLLSYLSRSLTSASPLASSHEPRGRGQPAAEQHFYVGYYLNQEAPGMPALELPPPEKMPDTLRFGKLQLGCELKLFSLYSVSYCAALYVVAEQFYLGLFRVSKAGASQDCYLSLFPTSAMSMSSRVPLFEVSVVDNLLAVHVHGAKSCLVFDLRDKGDTQRTLPAAAGGEPAVQIFEPVCNLPVPLDLSNPRSLIAGSSSAAASRVPPLVASATSLEELSSSPDTISTFCYPNHLFVYSPTLCTSLTLRADPFRVCSEMPAEAHPRSVEFLLRRGADDSSAESAAKQALVDVLLGMARRKLPLSNFRLPFQALCQSSVTSPSAGPIDPDLLAAFAKLSTESGESVTVDLSPAADSTHPSRARDGACMVVGQPELLRRVFLPLCLGCLEFPLSQSVGREGQYVCALMVEYVSTLRSFTDADGTPVSVDAALSLLLFFMLMRSRLFTDMTSLVHAQVFPDSVELAVAALERADWLRETPCETQQRSSLSSLQVRGVASSLQQFGVDMLWRLRKTGALEHWLAHHKQLVAAARMSSYLATEGIVEKLVDIFPSDIQVGEAQTLLGLETGSRIQVDYESLYSLFLHLKSS